jgi:hypothetical protein
MKKILIVFLVFVMVIVLAIAGATVYVLTNSKGLILSQMEKGLGAKVEASNVVISWPASLLVEDLAIGDKIKCRRLVVTPSLLGFLKGDVILNAVVFDKPVVSITRNADNTFDFGIPLPAQKQPEPEVISGQEKATEAKKTGGFMPRNFYIEDMKVIDGRVDITDNGAEAAEPFVGHLVDLQINVGRFSLLQLTRMNFDAEGRMTSLGEATVARLKAKGWISPIDKDMDAGFQLTDVDLTAFEPYYMKFIKKEMTSGLMLLTATLKSQKNDLTVDGHIELGKIEFKKEAPVEAAASLEQAQAVAQNFGEAAFESVLAAEGKVAFDFTIRTKLDQPKLEGLKLSGNFFQKNLGSLFNKPPEQTVQDFKNIGKQFKEFGKQFKEAFKNSQGAAS